MKYCIVLGTYNNSENDIDNTLIFKLQDKRTISINTFSIISVNDIIDIVIINLLRSDPLAWPRMNLHKPFPLCTCMYKSELPKTNDVLYQLVPSQLQRSEIIKLSTTGRCNFVKLKIH